jgi:hypothetical protein
MIEDNSTVEENEEGTPSDDEEVVIPHGDMPLSPRHRRLAELIATGWPNSKIKTELKYSDSRLSILRGNALIREAVRRIQDRIYEDTIASRMKKMTDPALSEIEKCLMDKTNRYKEQLKVDTAKWIIEKIDGKAIQKHDVSGGILVGLLDRLDTLKSTGQNVDSLPEMIDVTPLLGEPPLDAPAQEDSEEEKMLRQWANEF